MIIFFIFLIFPSFARGDCLQISNNYTKECFACAFSFYNEKYFLTNESALSCSLRLNESYIRKIFIQSGFCENCTENTYDKTYFNIADAFLFETQMSLKYQYSNLTFYLSDGYHIINNSESHDYFKQTLVDLTIISAYSKKAYLSFKNRNFSLFISKSLNIIDLNIIGENSFPFSDNPIISALINIEKLLDYETEEPFVTLINCNIDNFHGFDIIFNLVFPFGKIFLENLNISRSSFGIGLVYYFSNEEPINYFINHSNDSDKYFMIKPTRFRLIINNCTFLFESFSEFSGRLVTLVNLNYSISITYSNFQGILFSDHLLFIENSKNRGEIIVFNSNFSNIKGIAMFSVRNLSYFYLKDINFALLETINAVFQIYICTNLMISNIYSSNVTSRFFIEIDSALMILEQTFIFSSKLEYFIFQTYSSMTYIINSTFSQILIGESLMYIEKSLSLFIFSCSIMNITSNDSLFLLKSANSLNIYSSMIYFCTCFALFLLDQIQYHLNEGIIIVQNIISLMWVNEYICKNVSFVNSEIKMNLFNIAFSFNFGIPDMVLNLKNTTIFLNEMNSNSFMIWLTGVIIFQDLKFVENIAINKNVFVSVFDIEMNYLFITDSYFENNGLKTKKTQYISFVDNNLFFFWICTIIKISSSIFVASDKTELPSGFISAFPLGDSIDINKCKFILIKNEYSNNMYKGLMIEKFKKAILSNNQFFNLQCNDRAFATEHGSIYLSGSSSYVINKNDLALSLINNSFYGCNCYKGGSLAIINIKNVLIENCFFFNSSAISLGGSFFIISCFHVRMENIYIRNSSSMDSGAFYLKNIKNTEIIGLIGIHCFSYKNKVVSLENLNSIIIQNVYAHNSFSSDRGGFFFIYNTYLELSSGLFSKTICLENGGIFFVNGKSNVILKKVHSLQSEAKNGGFIYVQDCIKFNLLDSLIFEAISFQNGGALFIINFNESMINNLYVHKCISIEAGIIFIVNQDEQSNITINSLECHQSIASIGSCLFLSSSCFLEINQLTIEQSGSLPLFFFSSVPTDLILKNIILRNNIIQSSIIYFENKNFDLSHILFLNNSVNEYLIGMKFCTANITYFTSNKNLDQSVIAVEFSKITINFSFVGKNLNSILISLDSSILLTNNIFLSLFLANSQSYFFTCIISIINIENSSFYNSIGNVMEAIQSDLLIKNFIILQIVAKNDLSVHFHVENALKETKTLKLNNIYFKTNDSSLFQITGNFNITIYSCEFINIDNNKSDLFLFAFSFENTGKEIRIFKSTFYNFTESSITIRSIFELQPIYIISSNFSWNRAIKGSSIFSEGLLKINISFCLFYQNKAVQNVKEGLLGGIAACIFFKGLTFNNQNSVIYLHSNIFLENFAQNIIPTIFSNILPFIDQSNLFIRNFDAANFTNTFSAFPPKIQLNTFFNESKIGNKIPISSGHEFVLSFFICDFLEQKLFFDSNTVFTLKNAGIQSSEQFAIKNNVATSYKGDITFNYLTINGDPGLNFNLSLAASSLVSLSSAPISFDFNFYILNCPIGHILKPDRTCRQCPPSSFSLQDPIKTAIHLQKCLICPKNTVCLDGNRIIPLPGI